MNSVAERHERACDREPRPALSIPCAGRQCENRWTCAHHAADQCAPIRVLRMTECVVVNGERLRYVPAPNHRPLYAEETDWGTL